MFETYPPATMGRISNQGTWYQCDFQTMSSLCKQARYQEELEKTVLTATVLSPKCLLWSLQSIRPFSLQLVLVLVVVFLRLPLAVVSKKERNRDMRYWSMAEWRDLVALASTRMALSHGNKLVSWYTREYEKTMVFIQASTIRLPIFFVKLTTVLHPAWCSLVCVISFVWSWIDIS